MPQFPHHSNLCHCCQSIAHLSPEIMAEKSTKGGDLTLTEKLIHGDFPTRELLFQSSRGKKKRTADAVYPWTSVGYMCFLQLSVFTAERTFCSLETFPLKISLHLFSELQTAARIRRRTNIPCGTVKKKINKFSKTYLDSKFGLILCLRWAS